ncbi:IS4 family transposase [Desulfogranum japonicum]|uniref:IS4 family transposase n=1 Tax=Desulfogranum japonicum TaxID=231447 RepID=UPI0004263BF2|nr:IS4 family transposase [Desulfogranum japonicum]
MIHKNDYSFIERSIRDQIYTQLDPMEIDKLARDCEFVQRTGSINGFTFLCLLVFNSDNLASESLNDLTVKLELDYGISIKKQSLDERFNRHAVCFLKTALGQLLSKQISRNNPLLLKCKYFNRILIKDSVCFQVDKTLAEYYPGSGGSGSTANVRIQFEYDLLSGQLVDLSLNAFNDQDATNSTMTLDVIGEGDLVIRDLAYMHLNALKGIVKNLGYFLCRLQSQQDVYQIRDGEVMKCNFGQIVKTMKKYGVEKIEERVFLDKEQEFDVRLLIYLLPEEIYQERIRKAKKNAKKKGRQLTKKFKARCKLNLFITSAEEKMISLETAWKAYTLRWQIELGFKVWKSLWKIDNVKKVKKERLECYIWSKLFIIVLSWQVLWVTNALLRKLDDQSLSFYKASKTIIHSLDNFKQALLGGTLTTVKFLVGFFDLSRRRHLLEKKNRSNNHFPDILFGTFSLSYDGEVIQMAG